MYSGIRRLEELHAVLSAAGLLMMAPLATCWGQDWDPPEDRIPRSEATYTARVFSADTGAPIPGVKIRAQANYIRWYCTSGDNDGNCSDCQSSDQYSFRTGTADETGRVEATFYFVHCEYDAEHPMWVSTALQSWGTPTLVGSDGSSGVGFILSHIERGADGVQDFIYLIREEDLAARFAPVIHGHRGRELQADLADLVETVDEHASLSAYDYTGRRIHGPSSPPPLHIVGSGLNSYGQSTTPEIWELNIDDDWVHAGASVDERPLYYHVFPHEGGVVIQYWFWFNGNDLRGLPGTGSHHEGDWEYLSLYVEPEQTDWIPRTANLSQHAGGNSVNASELWWSRSAEDGYEGLEPFFASDRTHPHVWLAANAHAVYNRFETPYEIFVDVEPFCGTIYADRVDYNSGGNAQGDHRFFRFDRLVNMGEFWIDDDPLEGFWQWEGGPLEYLKFVGRYGDSFCSEPPSCPNTCDWPIYSQMSWAPHSPLSPDVPHIWDGFRHQLGRWGNDYGGPASVRWVHSLPIGDYLGRFETCAAGQADTLRTFLRHIGTGQPAVVRFVAVSGNIVVHDADGSGEMEIGPAHNGAYTIEAAHISGSGELRLDAWIPGDPNYELATDLRAHIEPFDCEATSSAPQESRDVLPPPESFVNRIDIHPNPTRGGVVVVLGEPLPQTVETWQIHDAAGRLVFSSVTPNGATKLSWAGRNHAGENAPGGIYFVSLVGRTGTRQAAGSFTLLR